MMTSVSRSARTVQTLAEVDPEFRDFVRAVYGDDIDPEAVWEDAFGPIRKSSPDQSELSTPGGNTKRRIAIGSTVAGAGLAAKEIGERGRAALGMPERAASSVGRLVPVKEMLKDPKVGVGLAGAALAGDVVATDELRRKKTTVGKRLVPVSKINPLGMGMDDLTRGIMAGKLQAHAQNPVGQQVLGSVGPKLQRVQTAGQQAVAQAKTGQQAARANPAPAANGPTKTDGTAAQNVGAAGGHMMNAVMTPTGKKVALGVGAVAGARKLSGAGQQGGNDPYGYGPPVYKSASIKKQSRNQGDPDVLWQGTISKLDSDKRLAFGFASVVEVGGVPVTDRQGDVISQDEIEKAAYDYVLKSRKGGDMHRRTATDEPHHVSDLVESFVITDEKVEKMGLPPETPRGWWVGFKVHDDATWSEVKKGGRTGFSIHGRGRRVEASVDELMGFTA